MTMDEFSESYKARMFFHATPGQWKILPLLTFREHVSYESLITSTWNDPDGEPPSAKDTIKAQVSKLRKKLSKFEIRINPVWGSGYYLSREDRTKIIELARKAMEN
jgi:DNA-binding response OmpR family regulator